MTILVTSDDVRALVDTSKTGEQIEDLIAREEAAIVARYGAHFVNGTTAVAEIHTQEAGQAPPDLFLRRPISSVSSVSEKVGLTSTASALTENTDYVVIADQGRLMRYGSTWGRIATVTYVPQNDNAAREQAIIELVRLALERTAMKSEDIAGEYSYTTRDESWEAQRERIIAGLRFARW